MHARAWDSGVTIDTGVVRTGIAAVAELNVGFEAPVGADEAAEAAAEEGAGAEAPGGAIAGGVPAVCTAEIVPLALLPSTDICLLVKLAKIACPTFSESSTLALAVNVNVSPEVFTRPVARPAAASMAVTTQQAPDGAAPPAAGDIVAGGGAAAGLAGAAGAETGAAGPLVIEQQTV